MKPTLSEKELNKLPYRLLELLGKGKENAVTARELAKKLGVDERRVRLAVEALIDLQILVCSSVNPPYGFYLAANEEEVKEYAAILNSRAIEIWDRKATLEKSLAMQSKKAVQLPLGV